MANKTHFDTAKRGASALRRWRKANPRVKLELRRADFTHADLSECDFSDADLEFADFRWADLPRAKFIGANLARADFHKAELSYADFTGAIMRHTNLEDAVLSQSELSGAVFSSTVLLNTDLALAKSLTEVVHEAPSFIDQETVLKSQPIPDEFLRGCGMFLPFQTTVFRVVIGSPSDVGEERESARQALLLWNQMNTEREKVTLLPVMWEYQSTPSFTKISREQGAQPVINQQLIDRGDILISVFWSRIGTPTKKAKSGTLEEVEEFVATGRPVLLYFCTRPIPQSADLVQFKALQTWKKRVKKEALVGEFADADSLARRLREDLTRVIDEIRGRTLPPRSVGR